MAEIRLALGRMPNVVVWRNNTGKLRDERGRLVEFGLCVGSSDLIGYKLIGRHKLFFAIEVKRPGEEPTEDQYAFLNLIGQSQATWVDNVQAAVAFVEGIT